MKLIGLPSCLTLAPSAAAFWAGPTVQALLLMPSLPYCCHCFVHWSQTVQAVNPTGPKPYTHCSCSPSLLNLHPRTCLLKPYVACPLNLRTKTLNPTRPYVACRSCCCVFDKFSKRCRRIAFSRGPMRSPASRAGPAASLCQLAAEQTRQLRRSCHRRYLANGLRCAPPLRGAMRNPPWIDYCRCGHLHPIRYISHVAHIDHVSTLRMLRTGMAEVARPGAFTAVELLGLTEPVSIYFILPYTSPMASQVPGNPDCSMHHTTGIGFTTLC